jgi:hydroxypyruvate isomerase
MQEWGGQTNRLSHEVGISDKTSYITLRGCWCHITVLNVHAPTEDKTDDVKGSFYEELECVSNKLLKYHMKFLLEYFSAKVGRVCIFN